MFILANSHCQGAVLGALGQCYLHRLQFSLCINWKRHRNLYRLQCVNARCTGAVLLGSEVTRAGPTVTPTIANTHARTVGVGMQCGMPSASACLLDINFSASNPTNLVGIAVKVITRRYLRVLPHGNKVKGSIAATSSPRDVGGVLERLPEQFDC